MFCSANKYRSFDLFLCLDRVKCSCIYPKSRPFGKDREQLPAALVNQQNSLLLTVTTAYGDQEATGIDRKDAQSRWVASAHAQNCRPLMAG